MSRNEYISALNICAQTFFYFCWWFLTQMHF